MKNVEYEVFAQRPEVLMRNNVFLTACLAKPAQYFGAAIKTGFILTFRLMTHAKFFLKIGTKYSYCRALLALPVSID